MTIENNMIKIDEQATVVAQVGTIMDYFQKSECEIRPHFFMTGPTGSGKSYTISCLAEARKMQFLEINAAQLTREGISGNSLSKALSPLRSMADVPTVVFVDEFDKLFNTHGSADESRLGVQDEFLKVVESQYIQVFGGYGKYNRVNAQNLLFVFAGVFGDTGKGEFKMDDLRELGVRSEFLGRVGLCVSTQSITLDTLLKHVGEADLLNQYLKLHPNLKKASVVKKIQAVIAAKENATAAGFRQINTAIHQHFMNISLGKQSPAPVTKTKGVEFDPHA